MTAPVLLWFRQDLRLSDNPALEAAKGAPVLPVYVLDEAAAGRWAPGGAGRWWLHHSLAALSAALAQRGAPLLLLRGEAAREIPRLAAWIGAASVQAGRMLEPWAVAQEAAVARALAAEGRRLELHLSGQLVAPEAVRTGAGRPYGVYTPFARRLETLGEPAPPLEAPARLCPARPPEAGLPLAALELLPRPPGPARSTPDWAAEFGGAWTPGEAGARDRLGRFMDGALGQYARRRDDPGVEGSSALSPHLHWGEISPRQVWQAARDVAGEDPGRAKPFLRELLWREFNQHLLAHRREMPEQPLRPAYAAFPWEPDPALLRAWQRGRTGYPIVDAGMRQLWRIGWMHNRVRMVAASLLVKHLLQPWQAGADWFWDTLVDADLANNSANWQWVAGCGSDAAPYFRVFNPVTQGERFDPEGAYVRRWVPELARMPARYIHRPWDAPEEVRRAAGLRESGAGRYPRPVVGHAEGRARALAALRGLRDRTAGPAGEAEAA
ncbi:DNA photolyase family protein [Roseomonas sp. OT10]|uniref:cryptochrome/photolyase family protein n=1 Tax=Roseomonas cutis TaxID=2897332 RepID=UPI001E50E9B8|nr:deoxyribodipyrimidine photo-lyase [Roseomonas sp. OT10]UFN49703.1 DNA photolyase family protein [Roseomonas sp. OT10]